MNGFMYQSIIDNKKKIDHHRHDHPEGQKSQSVTSDGDVTEVHFLRTKSSSQRSSKSPAFKIVPVEKQFQDVTKETTEAPVEDHSIEIQGSTK